MEEEEEEEEQEQEVETFAESTPSGVGARALANSTVHCFAVLQPSCHPVDTRQKLGPPSHNRGRKPVPRPPQQVPCCSCRLHSTTDVVLRQFLCQCHPCSAAIEQAFDLLMTSSDQASSAGRWQGSASFPSIR